MIYNGGILKCADEKVGVSGALFIDDAYFLAVGDSLQATHRLLKRNMMKPQGVFQWAEDHNCEFGLDKFQLIDFTRKREQDPSRPGKTRLLAGEDLVLQGHRIKPREVITFLGLKIDRTLRWKEQGNHIVAKGLKWVAQIQCIAKASKGVSPKLIRRLYISVAIPRIFYAADVCFVTGQSGGVPSGA